MRNTVFRKFFQKHPELFDWLIENLYTNNKLRDFSILQDHCFNGRTMKSLATQHCITVERVRQILKKYHYVALMKLSRERG